MDLNSTTSDSIPTSHAGKNSCFITGGDSEACSYLTGFVWAMLSICLAGQGPLCRVGIVVILIFCTTQVMFVMNSWLALDGEIAHFQVMYHHPPHLS